jgi:hypothetical protein
MPTHILDSSGVGVRLRFETIQEDTLPGCTETL